MRSGKAVAEWKDVVQVTLFKRDLVFVDQICMQFDLTDGRTIIATEEMEGWDPLIEGLAEYLPGSIPPSEWFAKVVHPAFEPCTTTIWPIGDMKGSGQTHQR